MKRWAYYNQTPHLKSHLLNSELSTPIARRVFYKFVRTAEIQKMPDRFYIHLDSVVPIWNDTHYCKEEHPQKSIEFHTKNCILSRYYSFCITYATVESLKTKSEYFTRPSPQTNQWIWTALPESVSPVSYLTLLLLDSQEVLSVHIRGLI